MIVRIISSLSINHQNVYHNQHFKNMADIGSYIQQHNILCYINMINTLLRQTVQPKFIRSCLLTPSQGVKNRHLLAIDTVK